jgi:chromosome segregation ATPase
MKATLLRHWNLLLDFTMFALLLAAPVQAQDTETERAQRMEERRVRREEILQNRPELAERVEERRAQRERFLDENPELADLLEAQRAERAEFMDAHPELQGRIEEQRATMRDMRREQRADRPRPARSRR